jgi:hypothetical protein
MNIPSTYAGNPLLKGVSFPVVVSRSWGAARCLLGDPAGSQRVYMIGMHAPIFMVVST